MIHDARFEIHKLEDFILNDFKILFNMELRM